MLVHLIENEFLSVSRSKQIESALKRLSLTSPESTNGNIRRLSIIHHEHSSTKYDRVDKTKKTQRIAIEILLAAMNRILFTLASCSSVSCWRRFLTTCGK